MAARQANGLSGVWACRVLFFVIDRFGIYRTTLVRRGKWWATNIYGGCFHMSGEMRIVLQIERDRGRLAELIQQRPLVPRVDRGRCFVFEGIP